MPETAIAQHIPGLSELDLTSARSPAGADAIGRRYRETLYALNVLGPASRVHLPADQNERTRLARTGILAAAECADSTVLVDGNELSVLEALGEAAPLPIENPDGTALGRRMRLFADLHKPYRNPSRPTLGRVRETDNRGRTYFWIDSLGAAAGLEPRDARHFNQAADRIYLELVDNVHRWSESSRAISTVSVTDGGTDSFRRLHLVVADNGIGILGSLRKKMEMSHNAAGSSSEEWRTQERATAVIQKLWDQGFGDRCLPWAVHATAGHGFNEIQKLVNLWSGTINISTDMGISQVISLQRIRNKSWSHLVRHCPNVHGTIIHVTLEAKKH